MINAPGTRLSLSSRLLPICLLTTENVNPSASFRLPRNLRGCPCHNPASPADYRATGFLRAIASAIMQTVTYLGLARPTRSNAPPDRPLSVTNDSLHR